MLKFWPPRSNWQCSLGETKLKNNILFSRKKKGRDWNRSHRTPFPSVTMEVCVPPLVPQYPRFSYMTAVLMQRLWLSASGPVCSPRECRPVLLGRVSPNGRRSSCVLRHLPEALPVARSSQLLIHSPSNESPHAPLSSSCSRGSPFIQILVLGSPSVGGNLRHFPGMNLFGVHAWHSPLHSFLLPSLLFLIPAVYRHGDVC